jgi:hypothetical protein
MSNTTSITVINPNEGKRFKMNLKGEVLRLSIRKFKKYLAPNCGIPESEQLLKYNGVELGDDVLAGEVGISNGSTLTVERRPSASVPFIASPNRHQLELETIDQQRAMLLTERLRRDEELRRQAAGISQSLAAAEKKRLDLERERQERDYELARLRELEAQAETERQRVMAVREAETERESVRAKDLEARKNQMYSERNAQRQLEMQKLENERKKMLLAQQRSEYESEKARLERERNEYYERRRQQELEIREREFDLDKQELEAHRVRQELEIEKGVLQEQRNAQFSRVGVDKSRAEPTMIAPSSVHQSAHNSARRSESRQSEPVISVETHRINTEERRQYMPSPTKPRSFGFGNNIVKFVEECLANLATSLGIPRLSLDDNNTCVVSYDDRYTLLVTFDSATERLYLYSTLTTTIPRDNASKLKLYEFLMEGALLGRDMCGGGVGASLKNDFILLSTSVFLPESSPHCLSTIAPLFVDSLIKWRGRVRELGFGMEDSVGSTSHDRHVSPAADTGRSYSNDVDGRSQFSTVPSVPAQREVRPLIGIEVSDGQMVDGLRHRYYDGVSVIAVHGPAQRAGILPQDFVKAVKNIPVTNLDTFRSVIKGLTPGTSCPFTVDRAGSELTFTVFVGTTSD